MPKHFLALILVIAWTEGFAQEVKTTAIHTGFEPWLETPRLSSPFLSDSLRWEKEMKLNNVMNSYTPKQGETTVFFSNDQGNIMQWKGGALYGNSSDVSSPGLMRQQGAELNVMQRYGNFTFSVGFSANRYAFPIDNRLERRGMSYRQDQYGISGVVKYDFSANLSATIYGQYVSNPFYYSMAAFPYVSTSQYGGYLTFHNDNVGLDLGVNNHYDPFARRWITDPIVRPTFKVGKVKMGVDIGPVMKEGLMNIMGKKRNQGPIIMPDM